MNLEKFTTETQSKPAQLLKPVQLLGETPSKFKAGDQVILKSGSVPMTVLSIKEDGVVECVWWTNEHGFNSRNFSEGSLKNY